MKPIIDSSHLLEYAGGNVVWKVPNYFDWDAILPIRWKALVWEKTVNQVIPTMFEDVCFTYFEAVFLGKDRFEVIDHFWIDLNSQHLLCVLE